MVLWQILLMKVPLIPKKTSAGPSGRVLPNALAARLSSLYPWVSRQSSTRWRTVHETLSKKGPFHREPSIQQLPAPFFFISIWCAGVNWKKVTARQDIGWLLVLVLPVNLLHLVLGLCFNHYWIQKIISLGKSWIQYDEGRAPPEFL